MTLKSLDTTSPFGCSLGNTAGRGQLPHLDSLVQAAADQITAIRRERNTIHTVLVAVWTLEALNEIAPGIPHADALVKRTSGDILGVGRDGNSSDPVLDREGSHQLRSLDIPKSDGPVATSRGNGASVAREVERVDILFVSREGVADRSRGDIPYSDQLVLGTGGQVLAIGAEAHAADIQIAVQINAIILEDAELLAGLDVVNLGRPIATSCDILAVGAEANAADHTLVLKRVNKFHIQHLGNILVEDDPPIILDLLGVVWKTLGVQVAQRVVVLRNGGRGWVLGHPGVIWGGMSRDLR